MPIALTYDFELNRWIAHNRASLQHAFAVETDPSILLRFIAQQGRGFCVDWRAIAETAHHVAFALAARLPADYDRGALRAASHFRNPRRRSDHSTSIFDTMFDEVDAAERAVR